MLVSANVKNATPQEILKSQLALLTLYKPKPIIKLVPKNIVPPKIQEPVNPPVNDITPKVINNEPLVFIYHTHTSESYIPVSGKDHVYPKGDIVKVGDRLAATLEEKYNINCIHTDQVHDQVPFRDSYTRSQVTILKYLKEYPSFKVVLDVHRDATPGVVARCTIKGQKTATIGIIVGSDKMGLPHPNWKKNLDFANKLAENMNLFYPGLNSRVLISDARYNQHLHDHALIIEFGDQNSTLDEVYRAADLFAEILAVTMNDEKTSSPTPSPSNPEPGPSETGQKF